MAIIGNTVTSVPFIADSFSGNASTTSFSPLTRAPAGTAAIAVFIAGVYQAPGTYTLSGTTITFASAPASGVGNIIVLHLGNGSATQVPSDGSVTTIKLSNDTYSYINAAFTAANIATPAASYANSAFATANTGTASGSYANSAFATANTGTAAGSYANSAFSVANNGVGIDATQNTNITNAGTYANSAFSKANGVVTSAVAGTGVSVSAATGAVTFTNSGVTSLVAGSGISISGATGAVTVTASGGGVTSLNGQTGAVTTTSVNSIGSVAVGGVNSSGGTYAAGSTVSGGSIVQRTAATQYTPFQSFNPAVGGTRTISLTGTWRAMADSKNGSGSPKTPASFDVQPNLWMRVS